MTKITSLKLEENLLGDIKSISKILDISCSEFIRNAIKKEVEVNKNNFMVRLSKVEYCSEEENKEIEDFLKSLTDDDLSIIKKEIIEL